MSILSLFRRQKEDKAPEELDEALAISEEEGLFISTGAEQASPGAVAEPAAGASVEEDATSQAEIDDLLEAADSDPVPSTIGEAVAESSDEAVGEDGTAASQAEIDKMRAAQDEPGAAGGADGAPEDENAAVAESEVAPEDGNAAAGESEVDDLLEAAQDGEAAAEQEEANPLDAGTPVDEENTETSDDPLAAFGEAVVETEDADLLKDLEDVSVEELVTELREIRAMLPQIDESQEAA